MPLITVSQLKSYLQIQTTDTTQDDFLNTIIIPGVQSVVEDYCHRKFDVTVYTAEQSNINHKIFPRNTPIVSVQKIVRYDIGITGLPPDPLQTSSYRIFPAYIEMMDYMYATMTGRLRYVNPEESYVELDYTAGYATIPSDLMLATLKLAALEYKDSRENRLGIEMESEGAVKYTYAKKDSEMPLTISSVLDRYKKVRV